MQYYNNVLSTGSPKFSINSTICSGRGFECALIIRLLRVSGRRYILHSFLTLDFLKLDDKFSVVVKFCS